MRFVAIDFETANERRDSACAVGLTFVDAGRISGTAYRLIRPQEMRFNGVNVSIHGIDEEDVENEPEFPEVWAKIFPGVAGQILVAHNASFDISVLRGVHAAYGMPAPEAAFLCSMVTARRVWPGLMSYGLVMLAQHIGHEFEHHHAGADAEAAARIMLAAGTMTGITDPVDLVMSLDIIPGRLFANGHQPCRRKKLLPSSILAQTDEFDVEHPLFGKSVVFTGALESMLRQDAAQLVVNAGGECPNGITKHTDFLVLGNLDYAGFVGGIRTTKLRKAEAIIEKGGELEIISETDFLQMLDSGVD